VTVETLVLRNCTTLDEFRACVALQQEVWGFSDAELVPLRIFSLAPKIGGQVVGAWEGDCLVGFAMAIPGSRGGQRKFRRRFEYLEDKLREQGRKPSDASLDEMDSLWQQSKQQEKP